MPEKRKAGEISTGQWNVLDLFAGCGGFSHGFENTEGFNVVAANELDATAAKTYTKNFDGVNMVVGDLSQEETQSELVKHFDTPCDLIIGGPPDSLYLEYLRMVDRLKPKMFVMDADPEVLTTKTPDDELVVDKIWQDFYDIGYDVSCKPLNCAKYGVPQKRERVIFIGIQDKFRVDIDFPFSTHQIRFVSVKTAIDNLKDKANDEGLSHIIPQHDEDTKKKISRMNCGKRSKKFDRYRLDQEEPCETITSATANKLVHYDKHRFLTARECARLQSFPDDFFFEGSQTKVYEQIGNAVPPLFATRIADTVKGMLEKINKEESSTEEIDLKSSRQDIRPLKKQKKSSLCFEPICPITHEIMKDPVIAGDGFTYERKAIEEHFNRQGGKSPMTRQDIGINLIPNRGIKDAIDHYHEQKKKDSSLYDIPDNGCLQNREIYYDRILKRILYKDNKLPVTSDNVHVTYPNGNSYIGNVKNGQRQGRGVLTWADGGKYDGEWKNDNREGHGVWTGANGGKYDGEWKNDNREGHGVWTGANGNKYDGQWKNNKKEGPGVFTWANGDKYDGEYKNDKREGHGVFTWADGRKYDGEWKAGLKEGHGVFTWADGNKYDGEWKNDIRDGHGVSTWPDGNKYDGEWKNNKRDGHGVWTGANGNKYDGEYKNGLREGHGVFTFANGNKYDGEYKNDKEEGHGVFTFANGNKYDGEWKAGLREGHGVYTYANGQWKGDKYDGEYKNGFREGHGVYTYASGNKYDGQWKNGQKEGHGVLTNINGDKYSGEWINDKPRLNFI